MAVIFTSDLLDMQQTALDDSEQALEAAYEAIAEVIDEHGSMLPASIRSDFADLLEWLEKVKNDVDEAREV